MDGRFRLRGLCDFDRAHLAALVDLWVESWRATFPSIDFEARRGWIVDHLTGLVERGAACRVAIVETGEAAGFVVIDPASGYLDQIVVGTAWWGRGIAEALLAEARRLSPARIELDVNQDNLRAVAFYRREGFEIVAEGVNARSGLTTYKLLWQGQAASHFA